MVSLKGKNRGRNSYKEVEQELDIKTIPSLSLWSLWLWNRLSGICEESQFQVDWNKTKRGGGWHFSLREKETLKEETGSFEEKFYLC